MFAMLDTQSDACFISKDVAKKLGAKGKSEFITLATLTETRRICSPKYKLSVRGYYSNESLEMNA